MSASNTGRRLEIRFPEELPVSGQRQLIKDALQSHQVVQELRTPIGQDVGYQVRFADKTTQGASIKLMTDGILLAETQRDPQLKAYDTLSTRQSART